MKKRKFMVVSGFLGAGKTTSMLAFADELFHRNKKAAIICNDLGAKHLVDAIYTSLAGCCSVSMPGECICFTTEALVDKIKRLTDVEHADLVMSDIPGCGVGALDRVYFKLNREYADEFELAPFVVVADPERLKVLMPGDSDLHLPKEIHYLFHAQLLEADVIVLNKTDTISKIECANCVAFLQKEYPDVPVFTISAREKENIAPLVDYITTHQARLTEIHAGYIGEEFEAAQKQLSWYDSRFFISRDEPFDGNAFLGDYIESIRKKLTENGKNVPHLKTILSAGENDYAKASLIGVDYQTQFDHKLERTHAKYSAVVNARAACESELLDPLMKAALQETLQKHPLHCRIFSTECFGMMDEGR